jgi:hypothetical protein
MSTYYPLGSAQAIPAQGIYQTFQPSYSAQLLRIKIFLSSTVASTVSYYLYRGSLLTSTVRSGTYPVAAGIGSYIFLEFEPVNVFADEQLRFSIVCPTCFSYWTASNPYSRGYMNFKGTENSDSTLDAVFWTYMIGL